MYEEKDKAELAKKLATTLGDVVVFSSLAQGYHWNVIGSDFNEFHDFFGVIYEDARDSVDPMAENILKLGFEAPYLLSDFMELSKIREERIINGTSSQMLASLLKANDTVIYCLDETFKLAENFCEYGLAEFISGRLDIHKKWQWQIKATLGVR